MVDLGPRQQRLIESWATTVSTTADTEYYDFTTPIRTERLRDCITAFQASPNEETFADLWSPTVIRNATYGGPGGVLNNWHGSFDELAEFITSVQTANSYDTAWERQFPDFLMPGLWELYGRLDPADRPIITSWTRQALPMFGLKNPRTFEEGCEQMQAFHDAYLEYAGHATAGTDHEAPIYEEIEQFLHVATTLNEADLRDAFDMDTPVYDEFAGWDAMQAHGEPIELTGLRPVLDAFTTAANGEAYEDSSPLEHWGANHWETWKDDYHQYLTENVFPSYDLTALTAADIESFIDDLAVAHSISDVVPIYLLGGRWQTWDTFESISTEAPEEAAAVLSSLLNEESAPITERLRRFNEFYREVDDSGGVRMSLATMLLMFVHPGKYTMYRYEMYTDFFDAYNTYDIPYGFNPSAYVLLNDALHRVRADLDTYVEDDVRMLDVHSLLWVFHRQGPPKSGVQR